MTNLDLDCAVAAGKFIAEVRPRPSRQDMEKLLTETSAVLAANGPYAMFLHLAPRGRKIPLAERLGAELYGRLRETRALEAVAGSSEVVLSRVAEMSKDFHKLLLARRVLQQTLAYLRQHAKTLERA